MLKKNSTGEIFGNWMQMIRSVTNSAIGHRTSTNMTSMWMQTEAKRSKGRSQPRSHHHWKNKNITMEAPRGPQAWVHPGIA